MSALPYTTDPVADAAAYVDMAAAHTEAVEKATIYARGELVEMLTHTIRTARHIWVPSVLDGRETTTHIDEVVSEAVQSGAPQLMLMRLLREGDGPLVDALRNSIAMEYVGQVADELGRIRSDA